MTAAELLDAAWTTFGERGALRPEWLRGRLERVQARWLERVESPGHLFLGPTGSPAFALIRWAASLAESPPAPASQVEAGVAMLALYFAVRIQDDIVDEDADKNDVYVLQALTAEAMASMATAGASASTLVTAVEVLGRFTDAALEDDALRRGHEPWSAEARARQGAKFLPMAVPLLALAPPREHGRVVEVVEAMGRGLQLTNDLLGVHRDLERGLQSPVHVRLGLHPGRHPSTAVGPALRRAARTGTWRELLAEVDAAFVDTRRAAGPGLTEELDELLAGRLRHLHVLLGMATLRARFEAPRVVADIEVTRECNLRCPDCFVFAQERDLRPGHLPSLSMALVREILVELTGYDATLHLTGGEPMAWPSFWDTVEEAGARGIPRLVVNTNGAFVDAAAAARFASSPMEVSLLVSVDGPPGVHERARGQGMEGRALEALRVAHAAGVRAQPASILTEELVAFGVEAWYRWLEERLWRSPGLVLWPLFLQQQPRRQGTGGMLSPEATHRAARAVANLRRAQEPIVVADYPVINPLLRRYGVPTEELWACEAGRGRFCVQADATLSPCHPFRLGLGKLEEGQVSGFIARLFAHPDYRRVGEREHAGCGTCAERSVCGSCQAFSMARGEPLGGNDGHCRDILEEG